MQSPQCLALALVMLFSSVYAIPATKLLPRQSIAENIKNVDINLCTEWGSGGTCINVSTFAVGTSNTDSHVMSNYGAEINTNSVNSVSSITVTGDSGVSCSFGSIVLSSTPSLICGGTVASLNTGDPTLDLGSNNNYGSLNDNVLCFYCSTSG